MNLTFPLLQKYGNVTDAEMFRVFNMGIGFCVILPGQEAEAAIEIASSHKMDAFRLGYAVKDTKKQVFIRPKRLRREGKNSINIRSLIILYKSNYII